MTWWEFGSFMASPAGLIAGYVLLFGVVFLFARARGKGTRIATRIGLVSLLLSMALYQEPVKAGSCTSNTLNAYTGETITVSSTSIGFTGNLYDQGSGSAQSALVTIAGDSIRFWPNGQTPTASVGHLVTAGTPVEVCGFANIAKFRMIRVTTDATVTVSYFR